MSMMKSVEPPPANTLVPGVDAGNAWVRPVGELDAWSPAAVGHVDSLCLTQEHR